MTQSKKKQASKKAVRGNGSSIRNTMLLIIGLLCGLIFMPSAVMLLVGMLPSLVVFFTSSRAKAVSVCAFNFAGVSPYLIDLWATQHSFDMMFSLISDPKNIVVIYCAAAVGYLVDWIVTAVVASYKLQNAQARLVSIKKEQKVLVARWGKEVTGDYELDEHGFALDQGSES